MGEIAIKLNPKKLSNPDTDIRYVIPDRIEEQFEGKIEGNGFDYLEDEFDSLVIFLSSTSPEEDAKMILDFLRKEPFCENWLLESAVVGIRENKQYRIVHPENYKGHFGVE